MGWLYTQDLEGAKGEGGILTDQMLVDIYLLAHQFDIRRLKVAALNSLLELSTTLKAPPNHRITAIVWARTLRESPLRCLLIDSFLGVAAVGFTSSGEARELRDFHFYVVTAVWNRMQSWETEASITALIPHYCELGIDDTCACLVHRTERAAKTAVLSNTTRNTVREIGASRLELASTNYLRLYHKEKENDNMSL